MGDQNATNNYPEELPPFWIKRKSKTRNRNFYFNTKTLESVWTIPSNPKISTPNSSKCNKKPTPRKTAVPLNDSRGVMEASKSIVKKNTAEERLKRLQMGLKNELLKEDLSVLKVANESKIRPHKYSFSKPESSRPKVEDKLPTNIRNNVIALTTRPDQIPININNKIMELAYNTNMVSKYSHTDVSFDPHLFQPKTQQTPANNRLSRLRDELTNEQEKEEMDVNMDDFESMDWEEIPEQTINKEVEKIRSSFNSSASSTSSFVIDTQSRGLSRVCLTNDSNALVIVVDTNVFLHNLPFISDIQGRRYKNLGTVIIYIPYIVLQELDSFKNSYLGVRARRCIKYINEQFKSKTPYLQGQSAVEDEGNSFINVTVSDDRILNACFQVKQYKLKVVLLTNDRNLQNKALFNKIDSYSQVTLMKFNSN